MLDFGLHCPWLLTEQKVRKIANVKVITEFYIFIFTGFCKVFKTKPKFRFDKRFLNNPNHNE